MPRFAILLLAAAASFSLHAPTAMAGNGDELIQLGRYHCLNCRYGDPRRCSCRTNHHPCRDCSMSWQPIRSVMHPNMMPAGLIRPKPPLNRMIQNLIPKMPAKWINNPCHPWTGCNDENCKAY